MKVSIVTPSFNQGEFIERTLKSVLQQEGAAFEYIVVDGGSTDGTGAVLARYADRLDELIVEDDEGLREALVDTLALAGYEWLEADSAEDALLKLKSHFFSKKIIN